jgi:hypothetical protein
MKDLTEEEYDEIDDYFTSHNPKVGPNGSGFVSQREARLFGLDSLTTDYLLTKSRAEHTTPARIINKLVRAQIAAAL